jgi:hypothetical protein
MFTPDTCLKGCTKRAIWECSPMEKKSSYYR